MDNMNFDINTINKLKDMMNKGELNDILSKISPDMIQNVSKMVNNNNNNNYNNKGQSNNTFDINNLDANTILKIQSIINQINSSNDPRNNLLKSLKPYLREERKQKVDQYSNLLNMAKIFEAFNNNKENSNNE